MIAMLAATNTLAMNESEVASAAEASNDQDRDVRARIAEKDTRGAIAICARRWGVSIGRLCFAMLGVRSEADETVQETLLAAYDGMDGFRGDGSVKAWLFGIARRQCARRLEVRTRQERRSKMIVDASNDAESTESIVDVARRTMQLRAALNELRPTEREAVLLRYEADLSFKDVAIACGIDEPAARKRVSRALQRLRERLAEPNENANAKQGTP
jgi:RNA polymerase sigma-70 factor (ECF subfamily)